MERLAAGPVLVVESDRRVGETITEQLAADGFSAQLALGAQHARILARTSPPAVAVLGALDAPRGALELLREIRQPRCGDAPWERTLPAIVIGEGARELDVLRAFEAGADDFIARPASYLELRARLRAVLRRAASAGDEVRVIDVGPLQIDTGRYLVRLDGRELSLRRMEFELLVYLAREPERVFTKTELLGAVWGYRTGAATRTLDSHASRLRRKLSPERPHRWVISVRGVGYRLT